MRNILQQFLQRPQVVSRRVRVDKGWERQLVWHFPAAENRTSGVTKICDRLTVRLDAETSVLELGDQDQATEQVGFASIADAQAAHQAVWRALRGPRWGRWLLAGFLALLLLGSLDGRSTPASGTGTWTPPPLQKAS